ncbi:MAG TPA: FGGY family carbohydrate kinase, partial [Solirubrobacterales bacterium]|nr:FGGY family carbohydrate kinase [Solirubrobacterales bacterium]
MTPQLRVERAERFALAVDLGSGALKVGAVSLAGEVTAVAEAEIETERPVPGAAVQDASLWWERIRELSSEVLAGIPAERVVAVSCTGQWASTVPVDADGIPVGRCVTWLDTRGARYSREVVGGPVMGYAPGAIAAWIRRTAGVPSPHGGDPVSHMLFIDREEPEVAAAARWYMEPVDYLTMRFTGPAAATHASMSAAWLTDNRHLDRLEYDAGLVRRAGLDIEKLPPLVETGSVVGGVLPDVAAELGIDRGAQVVTGSPDLHSAALGTGAIRDGEPHMTISTTSWISLPYGRKKTDPLRSIATVPGLDSHSYLVAN